jgi:hypothetical protein
MRSTPKILSTTALCLAAVGLSNTKMRKHPITWISITAFVVLLVCFAVAIFNSGQQYHALLAEAVMYDDAELISIIREKVEHDNILALMYFIASAFVVFLVWYVACAFIIIKRMRIAGIKRAAERYCIPLLIFAGSTWWATHFLDSRPTVFHYDKYMKCLLTALAIECFGVLASILTLYFCCHVPWRKAGWHNNPK